MLRILFVDNDPKDLATWTESLKQWYDVKPCSSAKSALETANGHVFDLVIIDLRLEDDQSEYDDSGFRLANERALAHLPKVIFSGKSMSPTQVGQLVQATEGLPPLILAVASKRDGPDAVRRVIEQARPRWQWSLAVRQSLTIAAEVLRKDKATVRVLAWLQFALSISASILGFGLVMCGVVYAILRPVWISTLPVVAGVTMSAIGYLFFSRLDRALARLDVYRKELLQVQGLEVLVTQARELPASQREAMMSRILDVVANNWYPSEGVVGGLARSMPSGWTEVEVPAPTGEVRS